MRIFLFAFLAYLLYRILRSYFGSSQRIREYKVSKGKEGSVIDEMVQDPICRTYIPLREAKRRIVNGKTYFFCSDQCADEFEKESA